jgi:ABC-type multidrug transport system permease subunit
MTTIAPYRSPAAPGKTGFAQALRAELTKFRTVRGWVIGVLIGVLLMAGVGLLASSGGTSSCQQAGAGAQGQQSSGSCSHGLSFTLGPNGEPVSDSFYFVRQPLAGDGTVTVRVTSLTGLVPSDGGNGKNVPGVVPWAKAGLIIKENLNQGSAYAAIMVAADHGVRMQWNYTGDTAGMSGPVGPANPRWLRLTRSGDVITGYDSADGTHWSKVAAVTLPGLPSTAQVGPFTTSPDYVSVTQSFGGGTSSGGGPTQATAAFDHLATSAGWTPAPGSRASWTGQYVGTPEVPGVVGYHESAGQFRLTGLGDIAPVPPGHGGPADAAATVADYLVGTFAGLLATVVVAALFVTAEYRRGLIRLTLAATPSRGCVLAAKSVVVAVAGFIVGLIGAAIAVLAGEAITRARGYYAFPVSGTAEVRVVVGTAILAAFASVLALAIGTIVRRSAATVATVIVVIVLPYFFAEASILPLSAGDWLLRVMPAAGFALQQVYPAYHQVAMSYAPFSGYFPLAPWAGLAVLSAWTAVALALAAYLLRRRDA